MAELDRNSPWPMTGVWDTFVQQWSLMGNNDGNDNNDDGDDDDDGYYGVFVLPTMSLGRGKPCQIQSKNESARNCSGINWAGVSWYWMSGKTKEQRRFVWFIFIA